MTYQPEGTLYYTAENQSYLKSESTLSEAMRNKKILESRAVLCDNEHNLIVDLGCMKGIIPRKEGAIGIPEGTTRDIALISRVNKAVCFYVTGFDKDYQGNPVALLSRKKVQEDCRDEYISKLSCGDIIPAKVTHLEQFGCFVDIGCGIASLIPIDSISVSRISHPRDRFRTGQNIYAVVKSIQPDGKLCLSHKELLGTWKENACQFQNGETVSGIIRSIENYGVFIELTPNLAGLAELKSDIRVGQFASVYIKSLIPEKMKIKLIIVDSFDDSEINYNYHYYLTQGHIDRWQYSPDECDKKIESLFS